MNNDSTLSGVVLDEEFENLIKPLSEIEKHRQEFDVITKGFGQVRVWRNIVLCDSGVYKVCRDYDIPCKVVDKEFTNRYEALSYVCTEELKRDDLTYEYNKYLIGKMYNNEIRSKNSLKITKTSIAARLGDMYSLSAGGVQKYGLYAEAIDHVYGVTPELARFVLEDNLRISHESTIELARFPREELITIMHIAKEESAGRMTFAEIKHEIRWKNFTSESRTPPKQAKAESVQIKKMPAYDPDADIMGLAMTIPSWIKALNRAVDHTDMSAVTPKGRTAFRDRLFALDDTVIKIISLMEA